MICGLWRETDRRTCSTVFILHKKNTYVIYCRRYYKVLKMYSIIALTAISLYSLACNGQEERIEDTEKKGAFGVDGLHKHIIEWAGGWRQFIFIGVVCRSWLELYGTESERKLCREEGKEPKTTTVKSEILTPVSCSRTALDGGYWLGYEFYEHLVGIPEVVPVSYTHLTLPTKA